MSKVNIEIKEQSSKSPIFVLIGRDLYMIISDHENTDIKYRMVYIKSGCLQNNQIFNSITEFKEKFPKAQIVDVDIVATPI